MILHLSKSTIYDLICKGEIHSYKKELMEIDAVQKLLKVLMDPVFQKEITRFSGNDCRDMGKIITEV